MARLGLMLTAVAVLALAVAAERQQARHGRDIQAMIKVMGSCGTCAAQHGAFLRRPQPQHQAADP